MSNILIIVFIAAIIAGAGFYIYRQKKAGAACVGCPHSRSCSGQCCGCADTQN